jgi:hypothetical protein
MLKYFGVWHGIYTHMNRWSKNGVLGRVFAHLQQEQFIRVKIQAPSLDSTIVKVHPGGMGAEKNGPQSIGKSRGGWTTKLHLVAANAECAVKFHLRVFTRYDKLDVMFLAFVVFPLIVEALI